MFRSLLVVLPYVIGLGMSGGIYRFRREVVEAVDTFDDALVSIEDVDFSVRRKANGRTLRPALAPRHYTFVVLQVRPRR